MSRRENIATSQMFRSRLSYSTHSQGHDCASSETQQITNRPAQRGSPQNGPSAGRSAEAVWVLWETTGGLRLPLQPTTSDSGALLTFAHYNLPFRVSNKTAPVRRWSRSGAAGTAQGRLATFGCSRTHPSLRRCSILNTVLISQSGCRQYRVRGAGPF
jgi:hypothetical protein